jgi:ribose 1,5-bisphosphokinase
MSATLYYIIGASGAGKDSLLNAVREQLATAGDTLIAHRYITRPAAASGENHIALSAAEFDCRKSKGLFKLHWVANNCQYGVGIEIDQWLNAGINVLVNGSRGYLDTAKALHPKLIVIYINVETQILKQRLINRGRESEEEIDARLQRHKTLSASVDIDAVCIDNSGELSAACERLIKITSENSRE